jgi:hypothetical protein
VTANIDNVKRANKLLPLLMDLMRTPLSPSPSSQKTRPAHCCSC